ncbi:hypothetical protein F5Y02DRAFT_414556 [Annulohypoxylon stygium]|nr:hypothetical protein F5Y02DRAFT_414556 [Annulohypoxylon stygium]
MPGPATSSSTGATTRGTAGAAPTHAIGATTGATAGTTSADTTTEANPEFATASPLTTVATDAIKSPPPTPPSNEEGSITVKIKASEPSTAMKTGYVSFDLELGMASNDKNESS